MRKTTRVSFVNEKADRKMDTLDEKGEKERERERKIDLALTESRM